MAMDERLIGNHYQILGKIGEGGMGTVYKATDTRSNETVAVKLLKSELIADEPDMLERFQREGEALRQVNHPNIVKMLAMVEENDENYLVMEHVSGGDLRNLLQDENPLPFAQVLSISLELADALTRAHHLNIIHRDLKPANVLIASDGTPRLTDFGVAHMGKMDRVTGTGVAIGTLDYLSPELLSGEVVDNRSDIWSFGVMMFEMLTGKLPFSGNGPIQTITAIATKSIPDLEELCPDAPIDLIDLIYRMVEKNRDSRIRSVRLVGAELEAIMQGVATASVTVSENPSQKPRNFDSQDSDLMSRIPHNLPAQVTPFVGRETELRELEQLLRDNDTRLVTILASGGMGKSRLALELADRILKNTTAGASSGLMSRFAHGIYFVELAPLTEMGAIVSAIAEALGYKLHGGEDPETQIVDFLSDKKTLLILDNFEHLLDGVGLVSELMIKAPDVRILVTSRERLKLHGETLLRLEGMKFPQGMKLEEAMEYSATRLFLQSAQRAQPGFVLQSDDIEHVATIFRHVEGMPLGILMAAAWVDALSLPEIVDEISRSLDFLETDSQNVPERHRSIRAVFTPTWERLSRAEQDVFMKLSIFRGSFTREAAQNATNAGLRDLTALLGKALLSRDPNTGRYSIHELLRQYAQTQLQESSEDINTLRDLHCDYYATFLQSLEKDLIGGKQLEAATSFFANLDNVRAAWDWAFQHLQVNQISRLYFSLFYGSMIRNLDTECLRMGDKAVSQLENFVSSEDKDVAMALAQQVQSVFAIRLGKIEKAKTSANISLELINKLDLTRRFEPARFMFGPRFTLGIVHVIQGDFSSAERVGTEQLEEATARNDLLSCAPAHYILMIASLGQGKYEEAYHYAELAYNNAREHKNYWFVAYVLDEWGNTARALGNYDEALELYQKSYDIHQSFNDKQGIGAVLNHLASLTLQQGQFEEAEKYFQKSVTLNRNMGNVGGITESLEGLGNTMLRQGKYKQAEQHFIEALNNVDSGMVNFTLSILIGLGELWIHTNHEEEGLKLLSFVLNYHASKREIKDRVEQTLIRLGKKVDDTDNQETTLSLDAIIEEILREISKSDTTINFKINRE